MSDRQNAIAVGTQIAATATEYVTAASGQQVAIDRVGVWNTDAGGIAVTFYRAATGGTPTDANIEWSETISATSGRAVSELVNLTLDGGEALFAVAGTAAKVNLSITARVLL